jgi:mono/diheme cytochrome c family protein
MRHTAGLEGRVADLTRLGHYGMPPVKLSPQQVRDIVAYIESLGG